MPREQTHAVQTAGRLERASSGKDVFPLSDIAPFLDAGLTTSSSGRMFDKTVTDLRMDSETNQSGDLALEVVRVSRHFPGGVKALDDVTVRAREGEFLTILGQSGSGKTTLLRIIAGLDHPTSVAALRIAGKDVLGRPPHERNVTTVFQHFALFPHMSVGENIEYGLKLRGVDPASRRKRGLEMLETVRLPGKYDRRIHQLSGGERQRVALARSLMIEPDILLLDEPIGSLDENLRAQMQIELIELHRRLNMTFVYITHSQEEALTMSDRVILMRLGRIAQEGRPSDLFERPCSSFVGIFMGVENVARGEVKAVRSDGHVVLTAMGRDFGGAWTGREAPVVGDKASLLLRAEKVRIGESDGSPSMDSLRGRFTAAVYKGKYFDTVVTTVFGPIYARIWNGPPSAEGDVTVSWYQRDASIAPTDD
jgi:spermidine/putrescine transport system ATP-binding protein